MMTSWIAALVVSGTIGSDTTWTAADSPVLVEANTVVIQGVTLTVQPGVVVRFAPATILMVNGGLVARGTPADPIRFTSNQPSGAPGQWGRILFNDTATDASFDEAGEYQSGSILEWAVVEYAGGELPAVHVESAAPFLHRCLVSRNAGPGIGGTVGPPLSLRAVLVSHNASGVVVSFSTTVAGSTGVVLDSVSIVDNAGDGITATALHGTGNTLELKNSAVLRNGGDGVDSAPYFGSSMINLRATGNFVASNGGRGLAVATAHNVTVIHNLVQGNGGDGVFIRGRDQVPGVVAQNLIIENQGKGMTLSGALSVTNNVIANNAGNALGAAVTGTVSGNAIVGNGGPVSITYPGQFMGNTVAANAAGTEAMILLYANASLASNNLFPRAAGYTLENLLHNTAPQVNAPDNWWGTADGAAIDALIYDFLDNGQRGFVSRSPHLGAPSTDAPLSPPTGLLVSRAGDAVSVSWAVNPESDVTGYKVYYDADGVFPYDGTGADQGPSPVAVGNTSSFVLTGLPPGIRHVTVTAVDGEAGDALDFFHGHESWPSRPVAIPE